MWKCRFWKFVGLWIGFLLLVKLRKLFFLIIVSSLVLVCLWKVLWVVC